MHVSAYATEGEPMTISQRIEQPARPIDDKLLRKVCGHFVTGVTVITCEADGIMTGTTVNSFASVSLDPPLVLFCLHRDSRLLDVLRQSGKFAVNFLAGRQERLAGAFASRRHSAEGRTPTRASPAVLPESSQRTCRTGAARRAAGSPGGDRTAPAEGRGRPRRTSSPSCRS